MRKRPGYSWVALEYCVGPFHIVHRSQEHILMQLFLFWGALHYQLKQFQGNDIMIIQEISNDEVGVKVVALSRHTLDTSNISIIILRYLLT